MFGKEATERSIGGETCKAQAISCEKRRECSKEGRKEEYDKRNKRRRKENKKGKPSIRDVRLTRT